MWGGVWRPKLGIDRIIGVIVVFRLFVGGLTHAAHTPCTYVYIKYKKLAILKLVHITEKYQ